MDVAGKDGGSAPPAAHRPESWGLLPDVQWQRLSWRDLLHYWFVQFNPLYFISAMCILFGVFLVARNMETLAPKSPERAQLVLLAVIQAYEWLLIGGAALLALRARVVRPAVILALLEAVFLFDCTFRLESIVFLGPLAYWLTAAWFLLTLLKVRLLAAALRLQLPGRVLAAVGASALGIVVAIHWLSQPGTDKLLVLQLAIPVLLTSPLAGIPCVLLALAMAAAVATTAITRPHEPSRVFSSSRISRSDSRRLSCFHSELASFCSRTRRHSWANGTSKRRRRILMMYAPIASRPAPIATYTNIVVPIGPKNVIAPASSP
jgi:hypothetical protein